MLWAGTILLFPLAVPAQVNEGLVGGFAGVWSDPDRFDEVVSPPVVRRRLTIFQHGRRVCGGLQLSDTSGKLMVRYVFAGVASRNHIDLQLDAGSRGQRFYSPVYPFDPAKRIRVSKMGRVLILPGVPATHDDEAREGGSDTRTGHAAGFPVFYQAQVARADALDAAIHGAGIKFLGKCLNHPVSEQ